MRVTFWGTRGSIAKPGKDTVRYGGNTSCVEVECADGTRIVLDCGTGAHALGQSLLSGPRKALRGNILIGHTHWDHIQGIPFFAPLFVQGNEWDIYAPRGLGVALRETLAGQMQYTYFPVALQDLGATIRYHDIDEGIFHIGPVKVTAQYLNHPALTLGYRLEVGGVSMVYATDHEPHARPIPGTDAPLPGRAPREALHAEDRRHLEFISGADLLIHDTQYTAAEYPSRIGWGHSTVDYVEGVALEAGVKRLALFHHDPMRGDDALDEIVRSVGERAKQAGSALVVFGAAEGQSVVLEEIDSPAHQEVSAISTQTSAARGPVLVFAADEAFTTLLRDAVIPTGFSLEFQDATRSIVDLVVAKRPVLVVLPYGGEGLDALATCRALREHVDKAVRATPVVIISAAAECVDMAAGFAAGVTDWLTLPCSAVFIQARLRAWLLRSRARWAAATKPADEEKRIHALRSIKQLDASPDERFDRITRLVGRALHAPFVALNVIEADHQWSKSSQGGEPGLVPRDVSLCAHTILHDDVLMIEDADMDAQHGDNVAFVSTHRFRSYAGVALHAPDGSRVATICIMDKKPRHLDAEELSVLKDFAKLAENELRA